MSALEQLKVVCAPGRGELQPAQAVDGVDTIAEHLGVSVLKDGHALFSPPETFVRSPMLTVPEPGDVYRGPKDLRAFNMAIPSFEEMGNTDTLTVKGGDLPHMRHLDEQLRTNTLSGRLRDGQIPGGGLLAPMLCERDAALAIHATSLELTGELASVAIPLGVVAVRDIYAQGKWQSVQHYLNSADYASANGQDILARSRILGVPGSEALRFGDYLVDAHQVLPAEYVYAVRGHNIRIQTLYDAFDFIAHDTQKDRVFRTVYGILGETYGFDPASVLPRQPISDENYEAQRQVYIPERCAKQGIDELVVTAAIDRFTKVAAVVHSQQASLSGNPAVNGSFCPRNVTPTAVLDLDTYKQASGMQLGQAMKTDLWEMCASVEQLAALVTPEPKYCMEKIMVRYLEYLMAFNTDRAVTDTLRLAQQLV
ncbi:MAG TPA: hypothetical protein VJR27_01540 [Candidatus Saccharimonadales bacterium]|nr:hypothetical protein [Candidatus Saccharimonadales bacterium]